MLRLQGSLAILARLILMGEPIEVHVFGAKIGESIAVRLPGGLWGVVDTYTPTINQPDTNPLIKFLTERMVRHLGFLCLTHPHDDHYRGMSYLLETYRPDRVWLFGSATHRQLYSKVASVLKAAAKSRHVDDGDSENTDELVRILDRIQNDWSDENRTPRLEVCRLQLKSPLLELPGKPPVFITALGASGGRAMKYENTLVRCFTPNLECLAEELPRVNHNMISAGLLIEYGQARIVLGGDIESEAWTETMQNLPSERLNSNLVKVSHHGSRTGYCDGLWKQFSPKGTAVAVITPYSKQGLPSLEGLNHISENAGITLTTSISATSLATNWDKIALDTRFQGISADAMVTLRALFPKATHQSDRLEGMCSLMVAEDGSIEHTLSGEAQKLS